MWMNLNGIMVPERSQTQKADSTYVDSIYIVWFHLCDILGKIK